MRSAEQKNDIWKAIRIMTAAPILAMASLALLWIHRRNVFLKTNRHTIMQIVGGGVASLLAFVILSYLLGK